MKAGSLVFRLSLLQEVMAAALIVAFAALAIWITAGTLARQESRYVSDAARHVAANLERELSEEGDLARAASAVIEESAPPDAWVDVFDAQGHLVAASATGARRPPAGELHEVRVGLSRGAWAAVSVSTRLRHEAVTALFWALLLTALPLLVAAAVASRVLARRTLSPLSRLTAEADRAAGQAVPVGLTVPTDPDEIVTLSTAFDRLLARVHKMLGAEKNFSQDAAHELRTPLTVLSGELELALSDAALPARHRRGLEHAAEQTRGMSDLVEALMLLRRADSASSEAPADFAPVDLRDLVRDVVAELRDRRVLRDADLEVAAADEVRVPGNATLLAAAIRNLLTNAFKFTDPGQPVRITVLAGPDRGAVVVEDGGPGISPGDRERIFDPFFRGSEARAAREGVGLGLPIILRVARAHGGEIGVSESALGGARFELRLPAHPPAA